MNLWIVVTLLLYTAYSCAGARKLQTPCIDFLGNSPMIGPKCDGPGTYDDQTANRPGDITKVNLYYDGQCVSGLKPQYGFNATDAKLLGSQTGVEQSLRFPAKDQIVGFAYAADSCLEYVSFITATGQHIAIGRPGPGNAIKNVTGPVAGAYVWAFRGWQTKDKVCQFQVIWVRSSCDAVVTSANDTAVIVKQREEIVPVPVPTPVPIPVPTPVNVTVEVPTPVPVPTPVNISVPVQTPTPVPVLVPVPVPVVAPYPAAAAAAAAVPPPLCPKGTSLQTFRSDPQTSICILPSKGEMAGVLYSTGAAAVGARSAVQIGVKCWSGRCDIGSSGTSSVGNFEYDIEHFHQYGHYDYHRDPDTQVLQGRSGLGSGQRGGAAAAAAAGEGGGAGVGGGSMWKPEVVVRDGRTGQQLTVTLVDDNQLPPPTVITPPPGYIPLSEDPTGANTQVSTFRESLSDASNVGPAGKSVSEYVTNAKITEEDGPSVVATYDAAQGSTQSQTGSVTNIRYVTPSGRRLLGTNDRLGSNSGDQARVLYAAKCYQICVAGKQQSSGLQGTSSGWYRGRR